MYAFEDMIGGGMSGKGSTEVLHKAPRTCYDSGKMSLGSFYEAKGRVLDFWKNENTLS